MVVAGGLVDAGVVAGDGGLVAADGGPVGGSVAGGVEEDGVHARGPAETTSSRARREVTFVLMGEE